MSDLGALSAQIGRQAQDLAVYAGFVTNTLAGALPPEMIGVERKRGFLGRVDDDAPILGVTVHVADRVFTLRRHKVGSSAQPSVAHVVHGVTLSTTHPPLAQWCDQLADALARLGQQNDTAAATLSRITGWNV